MDVNYAVQHSAKNTHGSRMPLKDGHQVECWKSSNADSNPCIEESDGSQKCLEAYNYDKNMCSAYFLKYKNCRKYWHTVMLQRRREGIKPDMPTAQERKEMLASLGGKPY